MSNVANQSGTQTVAYTEQFVSTAGGKLYTREYPGDGPAFVLLHGFPDHCGMYHQVASLLSLAGRKVVSFDFLGYGASDKPGHGHSFEQQINDVEAVVDALGLDRIIPVGHDAGGPAAANFALRHPDRVVEVGLSNAFYGNSAALHFPEFIAFFATPTLKRLHRHFFDNTHLFAELLQYQRSAFLEEVGQQEQDAWDAVMLSVIFDNFLETPSAVPAFGDMTADLYAEVARNDLRKEQLKSLDVPFRLVWGAEDPYLPPALAQDIASGLARPQTTIIRGAGHWPHADYPNEVAEALLADLKA